MEEQKLWTKDFITISIINFILMLAMYLLLVTIAPFAVEQYGASPSMAGLVSGIFIIGTLFARIFSGGLIGKVGGKKMLFIGLLVSTIATAFYFGSANMPLLLANRLFHGIGLGIASTATGTMIAQAIPTSRRGEGIGYFSMSTVMATAIGPFFGIFISQHYPFHMLFVLCLALSIVTLIMFFFVNETVKPSSLNKPEVARQRFGLSNFIERKALPISIITLFVALAYSGVLSFISFYAKEINLVQVASFFFLVYAIVVLLSRPFSGKLLDVKGAKYVVIPSLLLFALGMIILSQTHSGIMLLAAGAVFGLGYGNFQSCAQAIALKGISVERLGIATSTFYIFLDSGLGFGPYFLGVVVPSLGYRGMYEALTIVILLSLVAFVYLFRTRSKDTISDINEKM
ncbi:MFS transporter [Sporosarcina luteola]|uniref:MFS transporter n=1 Tax=Sporosarcina luteola TaxID=582850 RepID=UPI002040E23B|nr:MFS transporter [Sporosarcina luteola]MCM3744641.1 MFS transporter [Sporosarcina luteola]